MNKTYEELEIEVKKSYEFTGIMNRKVMEMAREQRELEDKHAKAMALIKEERDDLFERNLQLEAQIKELQSVKTLPQPVRNGRKAGRKKAANQETIDLVLTLRSTGVSYVTISKVLEERLGVKLGRTTIGEIIRGNYELATPEVAVS